MVRYAARFFFAGVLFFLLGCQAPQQPTGPTEMCVEIPDRDQFIDHTLSILRQRDLLPSYVDRNEALIVAGPTTSGQWFEPWRSDVIGPYQALEANLHTIRRTVSIEIRPLHATAEPEVLPPSPPADAIGSQPTDTTTSAPVGPEVCRLRVTVDKARLNAPNRQATTAIGLMGIYSPRMPTMEGQRGVRDEQWIPLGRDGLLEESLLQQLSRNLTPVADAPPTEPGAG